MSPIDVLFVDKGGVLIARECGLRAFRVVRQVGEEFDDAVARTFDEVAREID